MYSNCWVDQSSLFSTAAERQRALACAQGSQTGGLNMIFNMQKNYTSSNRKSPYLMGVFLNGDLSLLRQAHHFSEGIQAPGW